MIVVQSGEGNKKADGQSTGDGLTGSDTGTVSQGQAVKKSRNLALTLKQDIARKQWEKKIDLSWMDSYLEGTLDKEL